MKGLKLKTGGKLLRTLLQGDPKNPKAHRIKEQEIPGRCGAHSTTTDAPTLNRGRYNWKGSRGRRNISGLEQLPYKKAVNRECRAALIPSSYVGSFNGDRFTGDKSH